MTTQFIFEVEPFNYHELFPQFEEIPLFEQSEEVDQFLGSAIKSVAKTVSKTAQKAANTAKSVSRTAQKAAKTVGKTATQVSQVVPLAQFADLASRTTPGGMMARAAYGGLSAGLKGQNVLHGAVRSSISSSPVSRLVFDTGLAAARSENIVRTMRKAAQAGINDIREQARFAEMVAPFIPGLGTGVAAALGAANALAAGRPITEAVIAAARSAIPGGAIAQAGFDMAINLAQGKNLSEAALATARARLPGGVAAQAAFDTAVALGKGKRLQDAAFSAAGRALPSSPYANDALSFARRVAAGENIQTAALSKGGKLVLNRMNKELSFETTPFEIDPEFQGEMLEQEHGFEIMPFEITPEFQGEMFGAEVESERGRSFAGGSGRSFRPSSQPKPQPPKTKRPPIYRPILRGYGRPWEYYPDQTYPPTSEYVRWVQDCLNKVMGLQLPVTGVMDSSTRSAIRNFQQRQGLRIDGLVSPDTEQVLKDVCRAENPPALATEPLEMEQFEYLESEINTNNPNDVRWLQESLNKILRLNLTVDGIMGTQTRSAIRAFQQRENLVVDSIVGVNTESAIRKALGQTTTPPSSYVPSSTRLKFEDAVKKGNWREAFLNLNGLNMYEMLRVLDNLAPETRSQLMNQRENFRRMVNMPRIEYAMTVVQTRQLPPVAPSDLAATGQVQTAVEFLQVPIVDWTQVSLNDRKIYVMRRLVRNYGFPENGAAGLVGNLWAESSLLPNRVEGSSMNTPMRASDFNGRITNFTAEQIMNRNSQRRQGPKLPGIGLAQWTTQSRRSGLFQYSYNGQQLGAAILFNMDAQIDYLVNELKGTFRQVYILLMRQNVTVDSASDEVLYSFETPGAIIIKDAISGKSKRLPRNDQRVQNEFKKRRPLASQALNLYQKAR